MVKTNKINLLTTILINVNIMIGAGVFMNTAPLTNFLGPFGFSSYIFSAILLLPIVLTIAKLAENRAVAGGLYIYNKEILGNSLGFLSGWSFFLGKITSAALLINTFITFFYYKIPALQKLSILTLDTILIFGLILLNIFGLRLGGKIQYLFASSKFIPLLFVIFTSLSIFNPNFFILTPIDIQNLFSSIPIAVYALLSFEMICSIGHLIENPKKNIRRAILYSFLIVTALTTAMQFSIFFAVGKELTNVNIPILLLGSKLFTNGSYIPGIINSLVFASILGGAFGLLSSNCWNLFALAKDNNFPFINIITKINKNNVPYISSLLQGILGFILLAITQKQETLQSMSVFGVTIAYLLSSTSLFKLFFLQRNTAERTEKMLPILALISSSYLIFLCIKNVINYGASLPFLTIFLFGIILVLFKKYKNYST